MAMRSPPSAPAAASTAAATSSSFVTSVLTNVASSPSSPASAEPFSSLTSAMVTTAPSSCRRRAVASPRPDAPPETRAPAFSICMGADPIGRRSGRPRQRDREELVQVGPDPDELHARRAEVAAQALGRELRADLRPQFLARGELDLQAELLEVHGA